MHLLQSFCLCLMLAFSAFSSCAIAAPKTDIIHMKNGDRVTGEIKRLLRGKLELKTDHMGTILIEWSDIQEVVSTTSQAVELANGTRFFGPLEKPKNEDMVRIETDEGAVGVNSLDIIAMYPVEAGFWDRLDISAKLGFSWDKSSKVGKINLGLEAILRDPRFISRATFDTEITTQENEDTTKRAVLTGNHMRFLPDKRFRSFFGSAEQNDELGLDLRVLAGAGYGWIPVRSQRTLLSMLLGLDVNYEIPTTGDGETNVELVGTLMYDYFLYAHPERHFRVDFSIYPSITQSGRYRMSLNTTFKVELFRDLYWDLSAYFSYDNKPLAVNAATSDYGVTTSFGYKF